MKNALICAARSAWYSTYEPWRLRHERRKKVLGLWSLQTRDPLVSVIIPTYNRCELLMTRALPSVLAQTYANLEILVCAHGCTDGTAGWVIGSYRLENRIRVIQVPRRRTYPPTAENHWYAGPVDPINAGLKAARGKFWARIDDDDEWTPNHIETLLRFAQKTNAEFVSSAYIANGKLIKHDGLDPPIGGVQTWLARSYLKLFRANPDCWRRRIHRVNDTELAHRYRMAGVRIAWTSAVTAKIESRPGEKFIGLKAYQQNRAETERRLAF